MCVDNMNKIRRPEMWVHPESRKYGRLTPVKCLGIVKRQLRYLWKCDCGNVMESTVANVRSGTTQSCGCLGRERVSAARRLNSGDSVRNLRFAKTAHDAKKRNLSFTLSLREFVAIVSKNCRYCGAPPN